MSHREWSPTAIGLVFGLTVFVLAVGGLLWFTGEL